MIATINTYHILLGTLPRTVFINTRILADEHSTFLELCHPLDTSCTIWFTHIVIKNDIILTSLHMYTHRNKNDIILTSLHMYTHHDKKRHHIDIIIHIYISWCKTTSYWHHYTVQHKNNEIYIIHPSCQRQLIDQQCSVDCNIFYCTKVFTTNSIQ